MEMPTERLLAFHISVPSVRILSLATLRIYNNMHIFSERLVTRYRHTVRATGFVLEGRLYTMMRR